MQKIHKKGEIRTMQTLKNVKRGKEITFTFFATDIEPSLRHYLEENRVTGWEILTKKQITDLYPHIAIPDDIRLTPGAPRVETRVSCLVSYFDQTAMAKKIQDIYESPEDLAWKQAMAEQLRQEREYQEAWAKDPSPVDIRRGFGAAYAAKKSEGR